MAKQVIHMLIDDLDGTDADETIQFSLDGKDYTIDLNAKNAAALRAVLEQYTEHGNRIGGRRKIPTARTAPTLPPAAERRSPTPIPQAAFSTGTPAAASKATNGYTRTEVPIAPTNKDVRDWANGVGIPVADRGRIKQDVVDQYIAAHKAALTPPAETVPARKPTKRIGAGI